MKALLACLLILATALASAAGLPDRVRFSVAIERGDVAQAREWLAAGLPPDFEGSLIGSGLMIGAWEGSIPMMALFLSYGANVNAVNTHGETALLHASWKGHLDAVRWLIAQGAQPNRQGKEWSALHYAAFAGHEAIVRYLLDLGANVNALSPNGSTPLMMAAREGKAGIVTSLLAAGAQGTIVNDNGENAVRWAMRNNNVYIAREIAGSKNFVAIAPAATWGQAMRSQPVPDRVDMLLAQARKMAAAGQNDAASKLYRAALVAIRKAEKVEKTIGKKAAPQVATGLVISAQRGNPAAQSAGLRYATPAIGTAAEKVMRNGILWDGASKAVTNDTADPPEEFLRRARELEAAGRRREALQAYRQAATLLRGTQTAPP
ncbi:ankyrin repeat domain-containing protein [Rugosibacter aromaticivorans]|uniref:ankyrin repeat domain-containing protein n=1 Tax=Rugosibacter aromaticivorans TaxID=1565605 RepID=UPI000B13B595|nr:ankyrin repeat domain-containing protein [Rugosibacter aromaticivorans]